MMSLNDIIASSLMLLFMPLSTHVQAGMICKQKELGHETTLYCNQEGDSYCCVFNGRVSCCSFDDYNREKNGPGLASLIAVALVLAGVVTLVTIWCWFNHRKKLFKSEGILIKM